MKWDKKIYVHLNSWKWKKRGGRKTHIHAQETGSTLNEIFYEINECMNIWWRQQNKYNRCYGKNEESVNNTCLCKKKQKKRTNGRTICVEFFFLLSFWQKRVDWLHRVYEVVRSILMCMRVRIWMHMVNCIIKTQKLCETCFCWNGCCLASCFISIHTHIYTMFLGLLLCFGILTMLFSCIVQRIHVRNNIHANGPCLLICVQ